MILWPHFLLLRAAGLAASLGTAGAYHCMAPQSQIFGATIASGPDPRQLALTFDDGPNDPHTEHLLDVLAERQVKATFFLIGRYVRQKPAIARRIAAEGHVIGNHTETHPLLITKTLARARRELRDCRQALDDAVGEHSNLFRTPFGGRRPDVLRAVRAEGMVPVMWSVTCYDWQPISAAYVEKKAVQQISRQKDRGNILLLHDGGHHQMGEDRTHTVAAADRLIRRYRDEGYEFVTVPHMMGQNGSARVSEETRPALVG